MWNKRLLSQIHKYQLDFKTQILHRVMILKTPKHYTNKMSCIWKVDNMEMLLGLLHFTHGNLSFSILESYKHFHIHHPTSTLPLWSRYDFWFGYNCLDKDAILCQVGVEHQLWSWKINGPYRGPRKLSETQMSLFCSDIISFSIWGSEMV